MATLNITETTTASASAFVERGEPQTRSLLSRTWSTWRKKPFGAVGGVLIVLFLVVAVAAPLIAPYQPNVFTGPTLHEPSPRHLFGTDNLGRDTFSRTLYGAQISLAAGLSASLVATLVGTIFGVMAYFGGTIDNLSQRALEILSSFPSIVLALIFIAVLGRANSTSHNILQIMWDLRSLELAIGLTFVFGVTRILRAAVIKERAIPYVEAARSIGAPHSRILWRHILPNIMPYIIVTFSSLIGTTILIEASLSFLGYGVAPGVPSWGGDLSTRNRDYFMMAPWLLIAPGVALSLLVIAYNFFGDALRDILDPRLRGSR
jgi:peptide/nickel transport system permease protein